MNSREMLRRDDFRDYIFRMRFARHDDCSFVTDAFAIRRILDHLGLSTPEADKPAPARGPARRRQAEGWGVPAEWE
jgi:hypothetical protein